MNDIAKHIYLSHVVDTRSKDSKRLYSRMVRHLRAKTVGPVVSAKSDRFADVGCQTFEVSPSSNGTFLCGPLLCEEENIIERLNESKSSMYSEGDFATSEHPLEVINITLEKFSTYAKFSGCEEVTHAFETLQKYCQQFLINRDQSLEEYEEDIMICKSELVELSGKFHNALNELCNVKTELASIKKLLRNCIAHKEQRSDCLANESTELNWCTWIVGDSLKVQNELDKLNREKKSLVHDVLKLKSENGHLLEKIEILSAQVLCGMDWSQDNNSEHSTLNEVMENACALQAEKHLLECRLSESEQTTLFLQQQLQDKACLESKLAENFTTLDYYRDRVTAEDKKCSDLQQQVGSLKSIVSTLDAKLCAKSKCFQQLLQEKNIVSKELNFCLSHLKQLNGNLEVIVESGSGLAGLIPIMVALQYEFTSTMTQNLAHELKRMFSNLKTFLNPVHSMAYNAPNQLIVNESATTAASKNALALLSEFRDGFESDSARNDDIEHLDQKNVRSSYCKFTISKTSSGQDDDFEEFGQRSCKVQ